MRNPNEIQRASEINGRTQAKASYWSEDELRRRCGEFDAALNKAREVLARFRRGVYK